MIVNLNVLKLFVKKCLGFKVHINMYNIHYSVKIYGRDKVQISRTSTIAENVIIRAHGDGVLIIKGSAQIGPNITILVGNNGITISDAVMIGPNCVIVEGKHDFRQTDMVMMLAPAFSNGSITIEEDVWIGANCTIGDNVTIGKGAIIGANSFVNKNVPPYEIHGGVPAKKISDRI